MPGDRLTASFGALYSALSVPRIARRTVGVLLVVHTVLLGYSAYVHSPTHNEPAHLVAGLSHWKFGRFELYRVNPPLVRMVAALPVMAVGYKEDWGDFYEGPGARPEMEMGTNFIEANGERSFLLFMIARWACIPFSWLGALICYLWARDLYGRPSGVLACAIWCFEPNILAHASLITPDAGATALGLAACYTFWRWLKRPTWSQAAITGVVLGLAELAKSTLILFYPFWPLMWLVYRLLEHRDLVAASAAADANVISVRCGGRDYANNRMTPRDWLREAGMLALRMVIGLYVLNFGYGFEGSFQQLGEFHFVSELFTGKGRGDRRQGTEEGHLSTSAKQLAPSAFPTNRFGDTWLGALPVPFPKNYLLGIDIQQKDFEGGGRLSYLLGEWSDHGWWYYYLYACAIKVPLGLWALGMFTLVARLSARIGSSCPSQESASLTTYEQPPTASYRDEFILLFPGLVIFTVVSAETGFSEHLRYILPTFPYLFVWISQSARNLLTLPSESVTIPPSLRVLATASWSVSLAVVLFSWFAVSSVWIYPHSLSYFNESIGGPIKGPEHLLGSNVDWGQDHRYLNEWIRNESNGTPLVFELCGPNYAEIFDRSRDVPFVTSSNIEAFPSSAKEIANQQISSGAHAGSYIVSVNLLSACNIQASDVSIFRPPLRSLKAGTFDGTIRDSNIAIGYSLREVRAE